ncbi:MAG: Calx-beta domain-containing protein [Myxococcota bacterium]
MRGQLAWCVLWGSLVGATGCSILVPGRTPPGIVVSPESGLAVNEAGKTSTTFTVALKTEPGAEVTFNLSTSDTTEGVVSPAALKFTAQDWNIPQTVTVTALDDQVDDGDVTFHVVVGAMASTDTLYNGVDADDIPVLNIDDDVASINVGTPVTTSLAENGAATTFSVVLTAQPTADVTLALTSSDDTALSVNPALVTFTAGNWAQTRTVTVTALDNQVVDGARTLNVVLPPATSEDPAYNGRDADDLSFSITDNEVPSITVTGGALTTTEAGGTATFTVVLGVRPAVDVSLALSSSDPTEGQVAPAALTFTTDTWNTPQTVTVTGADDAVSDGAQGYLIRVGPAVAAGNPYDGLTVPDVAVTNTDDDVPGINVTANPGLTTTEAGGTATFTVVLQSEPTANVVIPLSSSNPAEGTPAPTSLTFTPANWNQAQTVTVTGVNDFGADGAQAYQVRVEAAQSADPGYDGMDPTDVALMNTDDDTPGIMVAPTSGLVTTEAGGPASFTVVLQSQPGADVTIALSSSDPSEATVAPGSLTFTSADWNVAQTVTVSGVDDSLADGAQPFTVLLAPAVSTDTGYAGMDPVDVTGNTSDNDTPGFVVTPTSGLTTTEAGGTATFTVRLQSQPTADVTVPVSSSNTAEATVSPASLTFTGGNWDTPVTVTVTGQDDLVDDGEVAFTITLGAATSGDAAYNNLDPSDVTGSNTDDDAAGVSVTPLTGLTVTEAGSQASFSVVLLSQPTADVTITVASSDPTEGTVGTASLTFTGGNWDTPQNVTITGANDDVDDGTVSFTVALGNATSTDPAYSGRDVPDPQASTTDDDTAGITVNPTNGLTTTEAGGQASFTVVLQSEPAANVTIPLTPSSAEGTVNPPSITFTPGNWDQAVTVTVTGANDDVDDGNVSYTIQTGAAVSTDGVYSGMNAADVTLSNTDDDTAGIVVNPTAGLTTSEAGGQASFTVVLQSEPTANVVISVTSNATDEATVDRATLTFTAGNWDQAQTVTLTGVDDFVADGAQSSLVLLGAASSADAVYSGRDPTDVSFTNNDDDVVGVLVSPLSGLATSENLTVASFTVRLGSQPTSDVTIPVSSADPDEASASTASLTFTTGNWNVAQTVDVTGVDDPMVDGPQPFTITLGLSASSDSDYNNVDVDDVTGTNADNDVAAVRVSRTSGLATDENLATDTFTVVLDTQPSADVTVGLSVNPASEAEVLPPTTLTFTNGNWNVAQTVTVRGVDDAVSDGTVAFTVITGDASSADPDYNNLAVPDVTGANADNDTPAVNLSRTSGLITTEAATQDTFTVVLATQPTADVTITFTSSDAGEASVTASVTFNTGNWNTAQTVTVTGVDDFIDDNNQGFTIQTVASSADADYNNIPVADVTGTNNDDDTASISVTAAPGLTTSEPDGTATFQVVLTSQPLFDVVVSLGVTDASEGSVPSSITFTDLNWMTPQDVTITSVDDGTVDGSQSYQVLVGPASSSDSSYQGLTGPSVDVTNQDDDVVGILVSPTTATTSETPGANPTFQVVLTSQPAANVTVSFASTDITEGTVTPASVVFTTANWNSVRNITITGQDDDEDDGDVAYTITTTASSPGDPAYNAINPADVSVTNTDNDVSSVTITPTVLTTAEGGAATSFDVVLTSAPQVDVTVQFAGDNTEGTLSVASVTFNAGDWNIPQTVTLTPVNDDIDDGDVTYSIATSVNAPGEPTYSGLNPDDISVTNNDDGDTFGVAILPATALTTTEAGGTDSFTIALTSEPTGDVTIPLSSDNTAEGVLQGGVTDVTFTSANWDTPQTVTVVGVNDDVDDDNVSYNILTGVITSTDSNYGGFNPANVAVSNTDDDTAGVQVTPASGLSTSELGGTTTFEVVLQSEPTADVDINVASDTATEGTVPATPLTFTAGNWFTPQTVTITGVDDGAADGNVAYVITTTVSTTDTKYAAVNPADVNVTNVDDETYQIVVNRASGLVTTEAGGQATFTVGLTRAPTVDVTMALSSDNTAEGTVDSALLTFTNANWMTPQTVTITGQDDALNDGDVAYTVITGDAAGDANYAGMVVVDVSVTNADND